MNQKLLIANWKMNPATEREAVRLARAEDIRGAVLCPPAAFLPAVRRVIKRAKLGAQDASFGQTGPQTGSISAYQLKKLGATHVIIGHSERRAIGESNDLIAQKFAAALSVGLVPVLCVGERRDERQRGKTEAVIRRQLELNLALVKRADAKKLFYIAYEPVWAISTQLGAKADTPENAHGVIHYIRSLVSRKFRGAQFLYGGSVSAKNVREFVQFPDVAGALVGGASLRASEFKQMINIINS